MRKLKEEEAGLFTVQYLPNATEVIENPPRFSWIPENEENGPYDMQVSKNENFEGEVFAYTNLKYNFFAPDHTFEVGKYFWRYTLSGGEYEYSKVREFEICEGLSETPMPYADKRFENVETSHPRLWLSGDKLEEFKKAVKKDPTHCNFDRMISGGLMRYLGKPFVKEPARYPDDIRQRPLWRQSYQDCQDVYNRVRFLAVAGVVLDNQEYIDEGIAVLMDLITWDTQGSTARYYNDEAAFRVLSALTWGYDWLYNHFSDAQREAVGKVLQIRTKEVIDHVFTASQIQYKIYESHSVRSVSSVLIPCGIVLYGEVEGAEEWINLAVDYINVLYSPWGGKDGGWAEGGLYWTTGLAFLIDALSLLKSFTGVDIFKRPFFCETANFPLYCWPHDCIRASFCDQANIGEKPILKTGFNARMLSGNTKNPVHQWYCEQIAKRADYYDGVFYNCGWWDFYFDEMMYLSSYEPVASAPPKAGRNCKFFSDIGWVALHANMTDEENHIFMLTKSSKYGSCSHSHGDQNAILMHAYGDQLLIESGYYVAFNSDMHEKWRRNTISKSTLLFDGRGQYYGFDQPKQLGAYGVVEEYKELEKYVYVRENATTAYNEFVPELENFTREIYFVDDEYFVMVDRVSLAEELDVSFMLHSLYKPEFGGDKYQIRGEKANLDVDFCHVSSGIADMIATDEFKDVNPAEFEGLQKHWHYTMKTGKAKEHVIVTSLYPSKAESKNSLETTKAQGGELVFTFKNGEKEFVLEV